MKPETGQESQFLPNPPAFGDVRGSTVECCYNFATEKPEWCGYLTVKFF